MDFQARRGALQSDLEPSCRSVPEYRHHEYDTSRDAAELKRVRPQFTQSWTCTPAVVCILLCVGCLSSPPSAPNGGSSTIQVSADYRDSLWERAVVVLHRNHFQVARESKLEGVIETEYRGGSNILEPWHPDSVGLENKLESTLQTIRRRVIISMQSDGTGMMTVGVRADKEIEDLPGLAANYEGGATFQESQPLTRDLDQVVGQTGPSRWLSTGRDPLLERQILGQI